MPQRTLLFPTLLTVLLCGCQLIDGGSASMREQRQIAAELLRMEVRIAEEVPSLSNFNINGFRPINETSLVVTSGIKDHYLITLATPCVELPYAFSVAFERRSVNITNFDSILVNTLQRRVDRCPISRFYRLENVETDTTAAR